LFEKGKGMDKNMNDILLGNSTNNMIAKKIGIKSHNFIEIKKKKTLFCYLNSPISFLPFAKTGCD
jgi:hypothetical protein